MFIGVSGSRVIQNQDLRLMAKDPIVFALANPDPEILPEEAADDVRVMATGRSDYPNQINNGAAFPGVFRGALDCYASEINEAMKLAAAHAIAALVPPNELREDHIIPSVSTLGLPPQWVKRSPLLPRPLALPAKSAPTTPFTT